MFATAFPPVFPLFQFCSMQPWNTYFQPQKNCFKWHFSKDVQCMVQPTVKLEPQVHTKLLVH